MTRPLKILQVATTDITADLLLRRLARFLEREGHTVHFACARGDHLPRLLENGFTVHVIPFVRPLHPWCDGTALLSLWRLMRRQGYDLVHTHTSKAGVIGRLAARLAGVPAVAHTVHGFYVHENMHPWKARFFGSIEWFAGRFADAIFFQSTEDVELARRIAIGTDESRVWIGNGIDLERFRPGLLSAAEVTKRRRELGIPAGAKVVGIIALLEEHKDHRTLFEALRLAKPRLGEARLLVIGDGPLRDELPRLAETMGLRGAVLFLGFRRDTPELLSLMDVFVLPSHWEGLPRSILEAMAVGKPVVATDIRGCREEVVDGITGRLFPVGDARALADALAGILMDPDKARAMGEAGRGRAEELFDEEAVFRRMLHGYEKILSKVSSSCAREDGR